MSGRGALALLVSSSVAVSVLTIPAQADNPGDRKRQVDDSIAQVSEGLAGTSAELRQAYAALDAASAQLPGAQADLDKATAEAAAASAQDVTIAGQLAAAQQSESNQQAALDSAQKDLAESQAAVARLAVHAYQSGGMDQGGLAAALARGDLENYADSYLTAQTALQSQNAAIQKLSQQRAAMTGEATKLTAVRAEVADLKERAATALERARAARAAADQHKQEVASLIAQREKATQDIAARKAEEEAQLATLQRESDALGAELKRIAEEERRRAAAEERARQEAAKKAAPGGRPVPNRPAPAPGDGDDGGAPPARGNGLSKPVNGPITSPYGMRMHPIYHYMRMHTGIDFGGGCGTPIRAAADGTVFRAGTAGGYGNQIVINHGVIGGASLATSYNHLERFAVDDGARVARGQIIGYEGTTGASTGCHLHFEVFRDGDRVNPASFL